MPAEYLILLLWILFGGLHVAGSSLAVRGGLVRVAGLRGFKLIYSVAALASFVPLCWVYFTNRHAGAFLYTPVPAFRHVTEALMFVALFALVQGLATPNPLTSVAELTGRPGPGARGILRITRHPANLGFGLFGLAHSLANPTVGDWAFFGGFTVFAVVGSIHQDARMRASGSPEALRLLEETSALPFGAILAGRRRLRLAELRWAAAVLAVVVFVLLRLFHGRLIGGFGA